MKKAWRGFTGTKWLDEVNMRQFIQDNYTRYASFLEKPTEATNKLWGMLKDLQKQERAKGGVLDMETEVVSSMTAYGPGYIGCQRTEDSHTYWCEGYHIEWIELLENRCTNLY